MKFLWLCLILFAAFLLTVEASAIEIPLEKEGGVYSLPVRINGVIPLHFILDSGASEVSIPVDVFSTLLRTGTIKETDLLPEMPVKLADGSVKNVPRFLIRELEIAGIRFFNVPASVAPFSGDLLLGQSVLERLGSWTLDNNRHVLIIEQAKRLEPSTDAPKSLPLGKPIISPEPKSKTWKDPVTGMEFVWVPAGCFQMGCEPWAGFCWADEVPAHEVCLDEFWIGKHEVTQGQWLKLMPKNPSRFKKGEDYPVEQVSWNEVHDFLERLNSRNTQIRFRLPTEAEWEYAARSGGKPEMFAGGNDVEQVAWFTGNSGKSTHPVGSKNPNGLGIYDMSGNVWEWCEDFYAWDAYTSHTRKNPLYKYQTGEMVFRGGSWASDSYSLRTVRRVSQLATHHSLCVGFRPVATGLIQNALSPEQGPNLARKETPPAVSESKWLVVLGSYLKEDRQKAEEMLALLQPHSSGVRIVDTQDYPNLRSGLWAVVAGPFDKDTAEREKQRLRPIVPDTFIRSGW
jgi:formylglycine-generating enzyme required for sulfatase activity